MQQLYEVRKQYGGVFVTAFEDGLTVPWKPLSMGDYLKYTADQQRQLIPPGQLEDEIFTKYVQDESLVRQISFLKAGIVTTVTSNIWQFSGPSGIEEFNNDIETSRQLLFADGTNIFHQLTQIISMAFPYKPEEIYEMEYETFLFRLVQSEKKLLDMGLFLKEPISIYKQEDVQNKPSKLGRIKENHKIDAKKIWEDQQKQKKEAKPLISNLASTLDPEELTKEDKLSPDDVKTEEKWWTDSPVLEAPQKHNIDFEKAELENLYVVREDRVNLINDARVIYKDLLEKLAQRTK